MGAPKLITVTEAAAMLGIRPVTLYEWTSHGRFPFVAMGKRLKKIREADVADYIAKHTHEGHDAAESTKRALDRRLLPANAEGVRARARASRGEHETSGRAARAPATGGGILAIVRAGRAPAE